MTAGIIGNGTVGKALAKCYKKNKIPFTIKDKDDKPLFNIDFLNICFPFSENFISEVCKCIKDIKPAIVIIHSTVECGTADKIQQKVHVPIVSSPVRGSHNNLYKGLTTFLKYIGCSNLSAAIAVQKHFKKLNINSKIINSNRTVEVAKLLCTSYYGLCVTWHDTIFNVCKKARIKYHDIIDWNLTYNKGYSKLKQNHFNRPILYPPRGKIGGTCIIPNLKLLKKFYRDKIIDSLI